MKCYEEYADFASGQIIAGPDVAEEGEDGGHDGHTTAGCDRQ